MALLQKNKPPGGNRHSFVRTPIPVSENLICVVLLVIIAAIGVAIFLKGRHFDPDRFNVKVSSLNSTSSSVVGKSQTIAATTEIESDSTKDSTKSQTTPPRPMPTESPAASTETGGATDGEGGVEGVGARSTPMVKGEPLEIVLEGMKPMSPTEFYNADNLYEKIDGRSPAYQNFHVQALRCRTFAVTSLPGSFVDVYEYTFDSAVDAFGMFSLERDPKGKPTDFIADGYYGDMGWFFRRGLVYVQIIASDQNLQTITLAEALARNRARELPENDHGLEGRLMLPTKGLIPQSVSFIPDNAQGQAELRDVFVAAYSFDGERIPFFIMAAKPDEASRAWKLFHDFCMRFGKVEDLPDVKGSKIFSAQLFGKSKVVYVRGGELGGVFDVSDVNKGQAFIEHYLRGENK